MKRQHPLSNTRSLVELAILVAILLLLEFTGLGYIKTGILEFTIMQVPVIIGAILIGPEGGVILGTVFGLTSFWECFGKSAFGAQLLAISPVYTAILCILPRILMGLVCGLIFKALSKKSQNIAVFGAASLSGALLNTIFFMSALVLLFGRSSFIVDMQQTMGVQSLLGFIVAMVGVQGLLEALICCVLGATIGKAIFRMKNTRK